MSISISRRAILRTAVSVVLSMPYVRPSYAQECGLELSLLLDCSASMFQLSGNLTVNHATVQRNGHIAALRDKEVARALIYQHTCVRSICWNIEAWELSAITLQSDADIERVVQCLLTAVPVVFKHIRGGPGTQHDVAVRFALSHPHAADRHVIDVSTDGGIATDRVVDCEELRKEATRSQVQINALTIGINKADALVFKKSLCTLDGFVFPIQTWDGYAEAIRGKIFTEIS